MTYVAVLAALASTVNVTSEPIVAGGEMLITSRNFVNVERMGFVNDDAGGANDPDPILAVMFFILLSAGYSTHKRFVLGGEECVIPFSSKTVVAY